MKVRFASFVIAVAALSACSAVAGESKLESSTRGRSGFALVVLAQKPPAVSSSRDTQGSATRARAPLQWHNPSRPLIHAPPVVAK